MVTVHENTRGLVCPNSLVFLRSPDGAVRFLGVHDALDPLPVARGLTGDLIAISSEGWVGTEALTESIGYLSVPVWENREYTYDGDSQGVLLFTHRFGGESVPILRDAAEARSGIPIRPGRYRIDGATLRIR